jgi:large subunit ribosomal protein L23
MREPFLIIKNPRVTEKSTALAEKGKYVFKVAVDATKLEIKHAVKQIFKTKVRKVNTMKVTGKKKRERQANYGKRPDWKKAIVTLMPGEKIELA